MSLTLHHIRRHGTVPPQSPMRAPLTACPTCNCPAGAAPTDARHLAPGKVMTSRKHPSLPDAQVFINASLIGTVPTQEAATRLIESLTSSH